MTPNPQGVASETPSASLGQTDRWNGYRLAITETFRKSRPSGNLDAMHITGPRWTQPVDVRMPMLLACFQPGQADTASTGASGGSPWKHTVGSVKPRVPVTPSDVHNLCQLVDLLQRVKRSTACTWATGLGRLPVCFRGNVGIPERPGLALSRPDRIHRALSGARVQERAIPVG